MARLTKSGMLDKRYKDSDEAVAAHVASVVAENPRGAPITLEAPESAAEPLPAPTAKPLHEPFCVLDDAPVNSVLVALAWDGQPMEPHLQTPAGKVEVPHDDLAWKLPLLGEIKKTGPRTYVAIQRDDPIGRPPLVCSTAVEACQRFKKYFHDERD